MMSSDWASVMYGSDTSPAPVPPAKPAATPAPAAPATETGGWGAVMHRADEPTEDPGPWSGADPEALAADAATVVLPEKYEFDLPEGVEIAPEMNSELQAALKEAKLAPDQAKKLVDLHVKTLQAQQVAFDRTVEDWSAQTMTALGATAPEVFGFAKVGLEHFDKAGKLRELLDSSGLGNRIEFIRLFEQLGREMASRK